MLQIAREEARRAGGTNEGESRTNNEQQRADSQEGGSGGRRPVGTKGWNERKGEGEGDDEAQR